MTVSVDGVAIATLAANLATTNIAVGRKVQEIRLNGAPIGKIGFITVTVLLSYTRMVN